MQFLPSSKEDYSGHRDGNDQPRRLCESHRPNQLCDQICGRDHQARWRLAGASRKNALAKLPARTSQQ